MNIRSAIVPFAVVLFFWDMLTPSIFEKLDNAGVASGPFVCIAGFILGTLFGQVVLLALWAALGMEPAAKRVLRCLALLLFGCLAFILGFKLIDVTMPIEVSIVYIATILGGFCIVTTPLFVIRQFIDWSIYRPTSMIERSQFAIRDLFLWTAVIAVQIALAKFATQGQPFYISISSRHIVEIVFVLFVFAGGVFVIGLPTSFAAFGTSGRLSLFVAIALFVTPPILIEVIAQGIWGSRPSANEYAEIYTGILSAGLGVVTIIFVGIWIVRQFDFRLGRPSAKEPENTVMAKSAEK